MKFAIKDFSCKCDQIRKEEILNGKFYFLCSWLNMEISSRDHILVGSCFKQWKQNNIWSLVGGKSFSIIKLD